PLNTAPSVQTVLRGLTRQAATTSAGGHASSPRPHPARPPGPPHQLAALSSGRPALVTAAAHPPSDLRTSPRRGSGPQPTTTASLAKFSRRYRVTPGHGRLFYGCGSRGR